MKWYEILRELARARMVGITALSVIIIPIVLTGVGGFYLDLWLGTIPLFTIILSLLGLAAAVTGALKFKP